MPDVRLYPVPFCSFASGGFPRGEGGGYRIVRALFLNFFLSAAEEDARENFEYYAAKDDESKEAY